jgi:hypothetical protein
MSWKFGGVESRIGRLLVLALLMALAAEIGVIGVIPALQSVTSDFPGYYTSARIVASGEDASRLYDIPWFREHIQGYQVGGPAEGKFQPFPPPTALLLLPLARLPPLTALRVFTLVSLTCLVVASFALSRMFLWAWMAAAIFVLLSFQNIASALRLGQPYMLVSLSCILGYWAYLVRRPILAGVCFGLFVPIKYFPVIFLGYFAFRRNWKLVLSGVLTIAVIGLISIVALGWHIHMQFLSSVIGNHLVGKLELQTPYSASYQSFDALYRRLFAFDAKLNPTPWLDMPQAVAVALVLTKATILVMAGLTLRRLHRGGGADTDGPSLGLLGVTTLLIAPGTATYHMTLLWLPVALLLGRYPRRGFGMLQKAILAIYALIGFIPYGHTVARYEGRGGWNVLAFPRLFLLLALFMVAVRFLWWKQSSADADATGISTSPAIAANGDTVRFPTLPQSAVAKGSGVLLLWRRDRKIAAA